MWKNLLVLVMHQVPVLLDKIVNYLALGCWSLTAEELSTGMDSMFQLYACLMRGVKQLERLYHVLGGGEYIQYVKSNYV